MTVAAWVVVLLLLVGLLVRLPSLSELLDFTPARETYDALRARIIYLDGAHVPAWERAVLQRDRREVPQIEPPLIEHLAALGYRVAGAEKTWIPRLLSVLFWLTGGGFLYRLARRVAPEPGPLIALGLYLFSPFAIFASRSFQPDPLMVALTLAAVLTIVRFHEQPSARRLAMAGGLSALATLSKPVIPIFFLWGVYAALAVARRGLRGAFCGESLVFATVSFVPAGLYYAWGTLLRGFLRGHTEKSLQPQLWFGTTFWRGWLGMVASVVAYPLNGLSGVPSLLIGLGVAAIALGGLVLARPRRRAVPLLLGLWAGYLVFGLAFTVHVSTHVYYSLPLVPIIALSSAPLGAFAVDRLRVAPLAVQVITTAGCCLLIAAAAREVELRLFDATYQQQIHVYEQVGAATGHTAAAVSIDTSYTTPLLYYAWIGSSPLYFPEGQKLRPRQIQRALRIVEQQSGRPRVLIITATSEIAYQPLLRAFLSHLRPVHRARDYAIYSFPADGF